MYSLAPANPRIIIPQTQSKQPAERNCTLQKVFAVEIPLGRFEQVSQIPCVRGKKNKLGGWKG